MLGPTYRLQAYNATGGTVTVTAKYNAIKYASDGSETQGAEVTGISGASVGAGGYSNQSTQDNTTAKNTGLRITFTVAPGAAVTGVVGLYLQRSTDGGTTWPSDGRGAYLGGIAFSSSSTSVSSNLSIG